MLFAAAAVVAVAAVAVAAVAAVAVAFVSALRQRGASDRQNVTIKQFHFP